MGLTQFNNEYLMFGDEYIGDVIETPGSRYFMWRFDDVSGTENWPKFQMQGCALNNKTKFNLITASPMGYSPTTRASAFLDGNSATKWYIAFGTYHSGAIIFDCGGKINPTAFSLQIGDDTQTYTGRNPRMRYLYSSNVYTTSFTDPAWNMIYSSDNALPTTNYAWVTDWQI